MINLINGDCLEEMDKMINNNIQVELTVTSPPYDNLRSYEGTCQWNENIWKQVIDRLYKITCNGGCVVWIVNDATIKGSETGTSFKQALYFKEVGFNLHDTMIWNKENCAAIGSLNRYESIFEYMFIFSKGKPKTTNLIMDSLNKRAGEMQHSSIRQKDGTVRKTSQYGKRVIANFGRRQNIWKIFPAKSLKERLHPAPFPEQLANDHILSWSNGNDTIFDPFMGSGTTGKMAKLNNRSFIGIELVKKYFDIAKERIDIANKNYQPELF